MSTDRKLLELAAKAAGYPWRGFSAAGEPLLEQDMSKPEPRLYCPVVWNPLTDDDNAARLAAKLAIESRRFPEDARAFCVDSDGVEWAFFEPLNGDADAAVRRAIVRAAAEIGRRMEEGGAA